VWAAVVTLVAVAEELLLRGALYEALLRWRGQYTAIAVTAIAFAALHIPLYGWAVVPLDLAVGLFLGVLRTVAGSVTAPAVTHTLADLAGWWLR
jgi:membrane protease YdiL (CAAX protease family)